MCPHEKQVANNHCRWEDPQWKTQVGDGQLLTSDIFLSLPQINSGRPWSVCASSPASRNVNPVLSRTIPSSLSFCNLSEIYCLWCISPVFTDFPTYFRLQFCHCSDSRGHIFIILAYLFLKLITLSLHISYKRDTAKMSGLSIFGYFCCSVYTGEPSWADIRCNSCPCLILLCSPGYAWHHPRAAGNSSSAWRSYVCTPCIFRETGGGGATGSVWGEMVDSQRTVLLGSTDVGRGIPS